MVASKIRYDGKVAVVTGAGGGLGREYALLLASRGASVVVNDLGGSRSGEGKNSSAADKVVEEIRAQGGKAVADYNSVEDGEKIVKTALDNFGRIDILINNAGILRDKSFLKITEQDWDLVHRVHLRGSFMVSKAAWPHFRKQNYGRIIMTSSGAGVYGNFGQSNYGSAKLGLLGLSNTLSIEGAKYGIHCNTVIPLAGSRLTQDIFPPDLFDQLKPAYVAPLVAWLCHEECVENGGVFEAAGGWVGKYRWQRSIGKAFIPPDTLTPESVRDNWNVVSDMTNAAAPANVQEHTSLLVETMTGGSSLPKSQSDVKNRSGAYSYDADDAILYALGVGMSTCEEQHLKFLYENSEDFSVLPTFGTLICLPCIIDSPSFQEEMQKVNGDLSKLLHGEQYLELYQPFPSNANLTSQVRVADVLDKGSGAVIIADVDTFNERGEKVMYNQLSVFLVGSGNFGGKRSSPNIQAIKPPPSRQPDIIVKEKTSKDQAALYRLCGDKNPLHIDPSFAAMGGFPQPILHGLCFLGYATRHVLKNFANYDVKKFKRVKVRFAGPLLPGETVRTEMWKEGNRIHFQCFAEETGKPIITGGYIDLEGEVLMPQNSSKVNTPSQPISDVKSDTIFSMLAKRLQDMPELAKKIQAIYEWHITKEGKVVSQWTLDLKTGQGSLYKGSPKSGKAGCTLILDDDDMVAMTTGKLDAQKAFMSGKLKIKGNIMLTQKLKPLLDNRNKPSFKAAAYEDSQMKSDIPLKSEKVFQLFERRLQKNPDLVTTVQTLYQWNILKNGNVVCQWTLDLKNTPGAVYKGIPKNNNKPDCVFVLEDDLLHDIMYGQTDPQRAFMSGKLKITGNVLASQKLQELWEPDQPEADPPMQFAPYKETDDSSNITESPNAVKTDFIFQIFSERLIEEPEIAKKMKVVYHWNVLRSGKKVSEWTIDLKTGIGSIYKGPPKSGKADVTLTMDDEDVIKLMMGKLNPQRAFMTGRLKIKGNIMLTQKLNQLWQEILKSKRAVELPLLAPIFMDKPLDPNLKSEVYFIELAKRISRKPEWVEKLQSIYEWNITVDGKPKTQWTMDMKIGNGSIVRGPCKKEKVACSFTLEDQDFADLVTGRLSAQQAVSGGKVKVTGDTTAAQKLFEIFRPQSKL